jgi:hypothetical protein
MRDIFTYGFGLLATLAKALALIIMVTGPLLAAGSVRAPSDSILVGARQGNAGAGFVLMVSLQRAR